MKIINYDEIKRFDMNKPAKKMNGFLKQIINASGKKAYKEYKPILHLEGVDNLKGPYLILCNHNAFLDFKMLFPLVKKKSVNFVAAIDGFIKREWLMRQIGIICKRKFTSDLTLIMKLRKCIKEGRCPVIYPEARYSLCGTTAVLPEALGKMCKLFKIPVVTMISHGHHINSPFWDTSHERKIDHTEEEFKLLFTVEETEKLSVDELNQKIVERFQYDDFKWQLDNKIKVSDPNRAKGLHKVLYQCPHCGTEYEMSSSGIQIKCNHCGKTWEMTEYGELKALDGETEFSHIPSWYEWERENVKKEIENNAYSSGELDVQVDTLPNAKKFLDLGRGKLIHDMNGFKVSVKDAFGKIHEMILNASTLYSCHIEYDYLFKKGDCVDLNTLTDTWYIYPENSKFSVTKMALATEELYFKHLRDSGKQIKKGLA